MSETKRIGVMVGREWSWPPAFIEEVNSRDEGVVAEYVKIGGTPMNGDVPYHVIVDRISHEIPYYRAYLKLAVLQGCYVINNPFMWHADDKFFEASLATKLGIASPRTILLPNHSYIEGVVDESLRNLEFPLNWQAIADYVGMPAILKDAHGGGWKEVYKVDNIDDLIYRYNQSGTLQMILQEFIEWEHYVRCLCIDQTHILPMKYDPKERRYHVEHDHLSPEMGERIVRESRALCQALGYDMNTVEWAIRDGVPYAIDFMNPAPDMDIYSLTPFYFDWAVNAMADMCIKKAKAGQTQAEDFRWARYLDDK
ncbi:MAG: hypothetical protein KDD73_04885 [Anaerolineales bacterium]|nr:hypothetical protein [Anaerolineales bacterium]MCB9128991.1 hypothetical protein [Ardenticatenales bacterium]